MAEQYQYGMSQAAAEQKFEKLAASTADQLNAKIREQALFVMKNSGFFPESEYENMDEYDEFHDLCMELGHAFLKSFADSFMIPFDYDAGPTE